MGAHDGLALAGTVVVVSYGRPGQEHRALVVTKAGASSAVNGASLRVADVQAVLVDAGYVVEVAAADRLPPASERWCVGVAVSYVNAAALRPLQQRCHRTWLDAVDSWRVLDGSGVRAGELSYVLRGLRDAARLAVMATPDVVTWISGADRASDGRSLRGRRRFVLPAGAHARTTSVPDGERRAVLAADWTYGPNRAGLRWFLREVLPRLDVAIEVYGRAVPVRLPTGMVPRGYVTDERLLYGAGDVHLAPVPFGAGVKRKVLQPLLLGLPVVTTPAGARGLRPHPHLDVASTGEDFASAVSARLADPAQTPSAVSLAEVVDADDTSALSSWLRNCPAHP